MEPVSFKAAYTCMPPTVFIKLSSLNETRTLKSFEPEGTASLSSKISYSDKFPGLTEALAAAGAGFSFACLAAVLRLGELVGRRADNFASTEELSPRYTAPFMRSCNIAFIISTAKRRTSTTSPSIFKVSERIASKASSTKWVKWVNSPISTVAAPPFRVWAARNISSMASLLVESPSSTRIFCSKLSTWDWASLKKSFNSSSLLGSK